MHSSYNVIKKSYVSANSVYTVKAPVIPIRMEQIAESEEDVIDTSIEDAKLYAERIIDEAQKRSEYIINSANEEAERIKKDAYNAAFNKGQQEGFLKGREDGVKSTEDIRKSAENVLNESHRLSREYIENYRDEIVELSLHIAGKIIGYQVDTNDSIILKTVNDAINAAVIKNQAVIRVNPMDYAMLDCMRQEITKIVGENVIVNIVRDGDIKRGGCRIETETGSVEADIDSGFEKIREALVG